MNAEKLLVHDRRQRQRTEGLDASFVDPLAVFVFALEFECEVVRQVSALVIASQQPEGIRVPDLQRPEVKNALRQLDTADNGREATNLDTEIPSIDVITQEQIPRLDGVTPHLEELHQIIILPMDITTHGDGRIHFQQIRLRFQNLVASVDDP